MHPYISIQTNIYTQCFLKKNDVATHQSSEGKVQAETQADHEAPRCTADRGRLPQKHRAGTNYRATHMLQGTLNLKRANLMWS